jgi:hypothetical protein
MRPRAHARVGKGLTQCAQPSQLASPRSPSATHPCNTSTRRLDAVARARAPQDSDVNAEKDRIHQMTETTRDMLTICDLRRVYPSRGRIASRVAVNDLCLGVPAGQCFGTRGTPSVL